MEQTGAIAPNGQFYVGKTILIMFLATLVVAALIVQFLFGLHGDEANLFSRFVAGGNLGLNVLLIITLIIIGHAVRNAANQTAAATPPGAAISAPPSGPPASLIYFTDADRRIQFRVSKGPPLAFEGRQWKTTLQYNPRFDKPVGDFVEQLYGAGASGVYVVPMFVGPPVVDVQLPLDGDSRKACFKVIGDFASRNPRVIVQPDIPSSSRYVELHIPPLNGDH